MEYAFSSHDRPRDVSPANHPSRATPRMTETPPTDEIAHEPSQEFVESTNVWQFMQEYGIDDYDALIERTTTELDDVPDSGVDWFWDELVDYLGLEFDEDYDEVRDDSEARSASEGASGETASRGGPQFTDWYPG